MDSALQFTWRQLFSGLFAGYIGSVSFLNTVLQVVDKLRSVNLQLIYVCDPVMGDEGKLYVPPELVDVYRQKALLSRTAADYNAAGFDTQSSSLEIRLIQSQDDIRNPKVNYKAVKYN